MAKLTDKVSFDLIRYANCWEDADVLMSALDLKPGSKILSVGSAGDNSFSLLATDPEVVVAIDVNKIQLYLIELKKAAIKNLEREEVLEFLGFRESNNRVKIFQQIAGSLPVDCMIYWKNNLDQIEAGIINQGKFEKYFQLFARRVLPFIHTKKRVEALLAPKSAEEQQKFYDKKWNTLRWRLLFKIFFSRFVMGRLGRDPEFLKEVQVNVGEAIFNKAAIQLKGVGAQSNFILRYNLTGSFGELLPNYLQPENFEKIKRNLDKLQIREGYAEVAFEEFGKFHAMNLSNIFEYMNADLFRDTAMQLISGSEKGAKLCYWNLMVTRRISEILPEETIYLKSVSTELSSTDKGFFYQQFITDEVK